MLVKLMTTSAITSSQLVSAINSILTGSYTSTSQLSSTYFDLSTSSFTPGYYGVPTSYWTLSSGILNKPSGIAGKTNYLKIEASGTNIIVSSGNSASLSNPISVTLNSFSSAVLQPIYVRFDSTGFVHIWAPQFSHQNGSYEYYRNAVLAVPMNLNPYDSYSNEGSIKLLSSQGLYDSYSSRFSQTSQLLVSNFYNASSDTYTPTKALNLFNVINANAVNVANPSPETLNIGVSKDSNLNENKQMLVPLIYRSLDCGWIGGNISTLTGLYLGSSGNFSGDELVTVDSDLYKVILGIPNRTENVFLARV